MYAYTYIQSFFRDEKVLKKKSTKKGTESSNLYLGYQLLQKFETDINIKVITSSFCGIQDAAEI